MTPLVAVVLLLAAAVVLLPIEQIRHSTMTNARVLTAALCMVSAGAVLGRAFLA